MVLGQLALNIGRQPDPGQRAGLGEESLRIEHSDGEEKARRVLEDLRLMAEAICCFEAKLLVGWLLMEIGERVLL